MTLSVLQPELWSRPLAAWYLYDFANSFLVINATLYFSQWVVVDRGLSDFWFSLPFIVATAILVFLSPYVGEIGDRRGNHHAIFVWATIGALASGVLMFASGRYIPNALAGVSVALFSYGLFMFFLQLALVSYNAFLKHLAPEAHYGKTSGLGFAANQLGYIAGLLITLPITYGLITIFGADRLAPLLPATAAFFLFVLPGFVALRRVAPVGTPAAERPAFWRTFWQNLKESGRYPGVRSLLISFYFFSDAITSLALFSAIYLQKVFGASDPFKVKIFLSVIAAYTLGAIIGGILSDRVGHRRVLLGGLWLTTLAIIPIALVRDIVLTLFLFPVFGLAIGIVFASSRACLAALIPPKESGRYFGLYTFADRFASVIGPAVWGLIVWFAAGFFPWNYRAAALAMAGLVALGIVPLLWGRQQTRYDAI